MILALLLSSLLGGLIVFGGLLAWAARGKPFAIRPEFGAVSLVANFFDTLGIGSFAPTTAYVKLRQLIKDPDIPASLIAGYAIPTGVEALIFIKNVSVDPALLASAIGCAIAGAVVGSSVSGRLPAHQIRLLMGVGLLIAATLFVLANLKLMPVGGVALSLGPAAFVLACVMSFALGVLMNVGIGLYGPMLIGFSLLGLDPRAAFPIMMGSSALLQIVNGGKLLMNRPLDIPALTAMSVGGVPGVLIAAFIVRSLPLQPLRWGVVVVVAYAAGLMLSDVAKPRPVLS